MKQYCVASFARLAIFRLEKLKNTDKMHQNEIEGALIFVKFFGRIFVTETDGSGIVEECQIHLDSVVGIHHEFH